MAAFAAAAVAILLFTRPSLVHYRYFGAFPWLEVLALLASAIGLKAWRRRDWRVAGDVRAALPLVLVMFFYPLIPALIAALGRADRDEALARADLALLGGWDYWPALEALTVPWLSAWMALCYSLYGLLVLLIFTWLCLRDDREELDRFVLGFTLLMLAGYTGYLALPAIGPLYTREFTVPIGLPEYAAALKERLMDRPRIDRDCFPSLHTAITILCGLQLQRSFVRVFPWFLPVLVTIPIACVYLRYHYLVDVLAGIALAFLARAAAAKMERRGSRGNRAS